MRAAEAPSQATMAYYGSFTSSKLVIRYQLLHSFAFICILHYSTLFYTILKSFDLNISERQIPEDKLKLKAGESVGTLASTMMGDA